jgi:hypothetical protein
MQTTMPNKSSSVDVIGDAPAKKEKKGWGSKKEKKSLTMEERAQQAAMNQAVKQGRKKAEGKCAVPINCMRSVGACHDRCYGACITDNELMLKMFLVLFALMTFILFCWSVSPGYVSDIDIPKGGSDCDGLFPTEAGQNILTVDRPFRAVIQKAWGFEGGASYDKGVEVACGWPSSSRIWRIAASFFGSIVLVIEAYMIHRHWRVLWLMVLTNFGGGVVFFLTMCIDAGPAIAGK